MTPEIVTALVLVALCAVEWKFRRAWLRIAVVGCALVVIFFTGIDVTTVRRAALSVPSSERVRVVRDDTLSAYNTGVVITSEILGESIGRNFPLRTLAFGVLVWLAASPAPWNRPASRAKASARADGAG